MIKYSFILLCLFSATVFPLASSDALTRLKEGNARFASTLPVGPNRDRETRLRTSKGQNPFAIVLGCSDSRVPTELIFDQGIGDLFVIRVAGNVVSGSGAAVLGSVEYGVEHLGTKLILVLGHKDCGAVKAALEVSSGHAKKDDGNIPKLVNLISPAVNKAKALGEKDLLNNSIEENVRLGVEKLKVFDPDVTLKIKKGELQIIGGVYDVVTGKVDFLN